MKILIGVALMITLAIIGGCINKTFTIQHKLSGVVRRILGCGGAVVIFNMISLFSKSEKVCCFAYSGYLIAVVWLLYFLLRFSLEWIGNVFEEHVNKRMMLVLLTLDTISLVLNNVYRHLFKLEYVSLYGGESYFQLKITRFYYLHWALIAMLAVFCCITLFYKSITAPSFYRRKYLIIAGVLLVLIIANALLYKSAVDFSIIGYAVEGVCIYYCVFVYTPQRLMSKTLFLVSQDMSVGLIAMDMEGKMVYCNRYMQKFFDKEHPLVDKEGVDLEAWCYNKCKNNLEEFELDQTFFKDEEEVYFKVQLKRLVDVHRHLQGSYFVIQDRTGEVNKLNKERYLATHDTLTGLYNKEYFYEKSERYVRRNPQIELYMICTDIKDFKMINDFFGMDAGDMVLMNFAKSIRQNLAGGAVYGRLGNDIFGVLMPKKNYNEEMFNNNVQETFMSKIDKSVDFPMVNYIGVYEIIDRKLPASVMCDRARMAIATIKGDQHKRVAYYDDALRANVLHEHELINDLQEAIAKEQLQMYLQPQTTPAGTMIGAEALIRWNHPTKGAIMPGDFIPVFEKNGLIADCDMYIWETACKTLRRWKDEGRRDVYISVNISPKDFYFLDIYQIFTNLIAKYAIEPKCLRLEITETAVMLDFNRLLELIDRLRAAGFVVEMDDFGSGYSSLNMLNDIHVDVLKIDMAFLRKNQDMDRAKIILEMIINLSKRLGMPVITEGVETEDQVAFLTKMGCNMFQGYYFARPMPVAQFEETYFSKH